MMGSRYNSQSISNIFGLGEVCYGDILIVD